MNEEIFKINSTKCIIPSRKGRENQRWKDKKRLLSCIVATKILEENIKDNNDESFEKYQVLVISSSKKPEEWILPKGGWENDETVEECAYRELLEEAGVRGKVVTDLGQYEFISKSGCECIFYGFHVNVLFQEENWAEKTRKRHWVHYSEAKRRLSLRPELLEMLYRFQISITK